MVKKVLKYQNAITMTIEDDSSIIIHFVNVEGLNRIFFIYLV